jgi:hypothetical protein
MLVIMVRDVCNVNCAIGWLLGGILGALGAWKEMEWGTLPSQVPFFPFFYIFSLWVLSFSLNFLV